MPLAPLLPEALLSSLDNIAEFERQWFLAAHQSAPPTAIRLHPQKQAALDFPLADVLPWNEQGRYLPERPTFTLDPLFHAGAYYVQEASSQFLAHIVKHLLQEDAPPKRVLDLCAAPGGKSTLLASVLPQDTLLICNEAIRSRAGILEENMVRWGYNNTWVTANDPRSFGRMGGYADWVIADVPCSGSGMFRKNEKALTEWSPSLVSLCAARQQRILHDAWEVLHHNGILIYATCSYSQEENENILDYIADNFEVEPVVKPVPEAWGIVKTLSQKHALTGYRFFPDKVKGEGFFVAVLRKTQSSNVALFTATPERAPKKITEAALPFLRHSDFIILPNDHKQFRAVQPQHIADYALLAQHLYLRKAGINLGQPTHKEWVPEHDIALSLDRSKHLPTVELSKDQALNFLRKESLHLNAEKGWHIATYKGLGLGWMKVLSNRINNNLPKSWRIRMESSPEE